MSSTAGSSDPYVYPGTTVLKNLRDLTDQGKLERFEALAGVIRGCPRVFDTSGCMQ